MGLVFLCVFQTLGCSYKEPSLLDPTPDPDWYLQQDEKLPKGTSPSPLPSHSLAAAGCTDKALVWAQRGEEFFELWFSASGEQSVPQLLAQRPLAEGYLNLSLSPDGKRLLALRRKAESSPGEFQAVLELWTVGRPEPEEVSFKAIPGFDPVWTGPSKFLFAESHLEGARVFEEELGGGRTEGPELKAPYPHLLISTLAPKGWVIYDRTRPHDAHFWVRTAAESKALWHEILIPGKDVRLLGWWHDSPIVVIRDGLERSRFLRLSPGSLDLPQGKLRLEDGEELAVVGGVGSVVMKNGRIVFWEKADWGDRLRVLTLETKIVAELELPTYPVQGRRLYGVGDNRVVTVLEGPLQPPSLVALDLEQSKFSWLKQYPLEGLEASSITLKQDASSFHLSPSRESPGAPVLMEAYGGFRVPIPTHFDWVWAEWLRRGGSVRLEQIEGEPKGQEAARDELLRRIHSLASERIVLRGRSMGGTLALMAALKSPESLSAVWADSAVTDLLHYHLVAPGELWIPEFGDPREGREHKRLRRLSPLLNVEQQSKLAILMSASPRDRVVDPRHTTRFVQRWQEMNPENEIRFFGRDRGGMRVLSSMSFKELSSTSGTWLYAHKSDDRFSPA